MRRISGIMILMWVALAGYPQNPDGVMAIREGQDLVDKNSYGLALLSYVKAERIFTEDYNAEWLAYSYINIGKVHELTSKYDLALKFQLKGLGLLKEAGLNEMAARTNWHIGRVHHKLGNYGQAIEYFKYCMDESADTLYQASSMNWIGISFRNESQYDSATAYHNRSIVLFDKIDRDDRIAKNISNLGYIDYLKGDYESAIERYKKTILIQKYKPDTLSLVMAYNRLAESYLAMNANDDAIEVLTAAKAIDFHDGEQKRKTAELTIQAYRQKEIEDINDRVDIIWTKTTVIILLFLVVSLCTTAFYIWQRKQNTERKMEAQALKKKQAEINATILVKQTLAVQEYLGLLRDQFGCISNYLDDYDTYGAKEELGKVEKNLKEAEEIANFKKLVKKKTVEDYLDN